MKLGIMQPYFFPYIGYFQLIASVDKFVIYDNIKYTKKGWINRNRILLNNHESVLTLPIRGDSDSLMVCERVLANDFNREKIIIQLSNAYKSAPFFNKTFPVVQDIIRYSESNLFEYLFNSVKCLCAHIGIETPIIISSSIDIDHSLRGQAKVMAICRALGSNIYINPMGGMDLYSSSDFSDNDQDLRFLCPLEFEYPQFGGKFVPWLSIIDVLMFNSLEKINKHIAHGYKLVR